MCFLGKNWHTFNMGSNIHSTATYRHWLLLVFVCVRVFAINCMNMESSAIKANQKLPAAHSPNTAQYNNKPPRRIGNKAPRKQLENTLTSHNHIHELTIIPPHSCVINLSFGWVQYIQDYSQFFVAFFTVAQHQVDKLFNREALWYHPIPNKRFLTLHEKWTSLNEAYRSALDFRIERFIHVHTVRWNNGRQLALFEWLPCARITSIYESFV